MKKKLITMLMTLTLVVATVGCGSADGTVEQGPATNSSKETEIVGAGVEEEKTENVVNDTVEETVKLAPIPDTRAAEGRFIRGDNLFLVAGSFISESDREFCYNLLTGEAVMLPEMYIDEYEYGLPLVCPCGFHCIHSGAFRELLTGEVLYQIEDNQKIKPLYRMEIDWQTGYRKQVEYTWQDNQLVMAEVDRDDNIIAMGILNCEGEWVAPMTALPSDYQWKQNHISIDYMGNGEYFIAENDGDTLQVKYYIYNSAENKVVSTLISNKYSLNGLVDVEYLDEEHILTWDCIDATRKQNEDGTWKIEMQSEYRLYDKAGNMLLDKDFFGNFDYDTNTFWDYTEEGIIQCVNLEGEVAEYNIVGYTAPQIINISTERLLFQANDEIGDTYIYLLGNSGNLEIEPIKSDMKYEDICEYKYIKGEDIIIAYSDNAEKADIVDTYIYNTKTKELICKEAPYNIRGFHDETGMLLVCGERNSFYRRVTSLIDINDLDTPVLTFD